ncbi:MAG: DUF697 domain-containing protein [Candidatus Marinimicrobia bacterium]|nr:DUF697 domain-containing protein [Candidatus Neomarinimicrobiota bacterium]MBT3678936.1 DUF697 domain-containing protein [Candidatus Neomarinimicrobiota bacterium]MBT3950969.1 DUF697 domain-containing protein [Candidatus Neomarinimicrobiota bacterium]MBT4254131.1 DUF697 domain-containing protein [Candidatus Neomarinimicrobiota bacterium]MBT5236244.1 DUF697 domain-containing protein [Candidatus Neomarinimicrobiota bacterium]
MTEDQPEILDDNQKLVKNYMWWSMGAGLVPVPLVDMAAVTGVQLKMLADLSRAYDVKFTEDAGRKIVLSLLGSLIPNGLARGFLGSLLKIVPVVGTVMGTISMSAFSGAATYAIGKLFIQHYEAGGTLLDLDVTQMNDFFKEKFAEGQNIAKDMGKEKKK